ncbi:MAG: hypothetical protein EPN26_15810 [Rhodospirillales bacterium]|nr:MAG: hypothetical protein EPN26_15810 [Rhodospirillales bacterium]
MHYDYYIEPCQFCITRAKNGADISECGWCGSGEDTRHRSSHEHPGDIVKIPAGGYGYPYHDSPHPERKYYRGGRHIPALDGDTPLDGSTPPDSHAEKTNTTDDTLHALITLPLILSIGLFASIQNGFIYGVRDYIFAAKPYVDDIVGILNGSKDPVRTIISLLLTLGVPFFVFHVIIKNTSIKRGNHTALVVMAVILIVIPLVRRYAF